MMGLRANISKRFWERREKLTGQEKVCWEQKNRHRREMRREVRGKKTRGSRKEKNTDPPLGIQAVGVQIPGDRSDPSWASQ